MSFLEAFIKGGFVMAPILICSILMLTVAIERWLRLKSEKILPASLMDQVKELLRKRRLTAAIELCDSRNELGVSIIKAGLNRAGSSRESIKDNFESAGRQVNQKLISGLTTLSTIATISTLLGLMGTVLGMIRVFNSISFQGIGDPAALSGGIAQALVSTAAGLLIGIPSVVLYNYFQRRSEVITLHLEKYSMEVLDLLDTNQPLDSGSDV
jgi:biopolymer transport protein ExbB